MDDIHKEVLRVFADACTPRTQRPLGQRGYCPPADVFYESSSEEVVVRLELPGVEQDDITLLVDRRQLVVKGERRFPVAEGRSYRQVELDYGDFERRVRLTVDIDPDDTTASYENGILEVRLALARVENGACRIPIRTERAAAGDDTHAGAAGAGATTHGSAVGGARCDDRAAGSNDVDGSVAGEGEGDA